MSFTTSNHREHSTSSSNSNSVTNTNTAITRFTTVSKSTSNISISGRKEEEQQQQQLLKDRNFNDLKDLFQERIYGTVKGQYRISMVIQDIESQLAAAAAAVSHMSPQGQQEQQRNQKQQQQPVEAAASVVVSGCRLKAVDIGGGLGQMTMYLARSCKFQQVDYFDISHKMKEHLDREIAESRDKGELRRDISIRTHVGGLRDAVNFVSYSSIAHDDDKNDHGKDDEKFDRRDCHKDNYDKQHGNSGLLSHDENEPIRLIHSADVVCLHAVLEWLANPMDDLELLLNDMKHGAILSLLYYNRLPTKLDTTTGTDSTPEGSWRIKKVRKKVRKPSPLTPYHEFCHEMIEKKLQQCGFDITIRTGLRVAKYSQKTKGDRHHRSDDKGRALLDYLEQEQRMARLEPYCRQGRYNHVVAVKKGMEYGIR